MLETPEQRSFDARQAPPAPEPVPITSYRPVPAPLAVPVTGVSGRNRTVLLVALAVIIALLACGGLAVVAGPMIDSLGQGTPPVAGPAAKPEAASVPLPEPPSSEASPTYPRGPALNDFQGSDAPIADQVAELLPSYVYEGPVEMGGLQEDYALVRHKSYQGFRIVIPVDSLRFNDPIDDNLQVPEADGPKSRAFVRMWAKRHPGSVIWYLETDPDLDDDTDLMEVTYFASLDDFRGETGGDFRTYRYRYDRKSREWEIERG